MRFNLLKRLGEDIMIVVSKDYINEVEMRTLSSK